MDQEYQGNYKQQPAVKLKMRPLDLTKIEDQRLESEPLDFESIPDIDQGSSPEGDNKSGSQLNTSEKFESMDLEKTTR